MKMIVGFAPLPEAEEDYPSCAQCGSRTVLRTGAAGQFLACPKSYKGNNHGTVSVIDIEQPVLTATAVEYRPYEKTPNLDHIVKDEMLSSFGVSLTGMDRFLEGGIDAARTEPDHWMNSVTSPNYF